MITCAYIPDDFESFCFLDGVITHTNTNTIELCSALLSSAQLNLAQLSSTQRKYHITRTSVQAYKRRDVQAYRGK